MEYPHDYVILKSIIGYGRGIGDHEGNHSMGIYIPIAVIILFLNLTQPRSKKNCVKNNLWSLLDVIIPVNLLDATPFRVIYCIIMSCWGADFVQSLLDRTVYFRSDNDLLDAFKFFALSPTVLILKQALIYFPILACVDAPIRLLGHIIGIFYTLLMASYNIHRESVLVSGCSLHGQLDNRQIGISLGVMVPVYFFYLVVAVWFFISAAMEIALLFTKNHHLSEYCEHNSYVKYVKELLNKTDQHVPVVVKRTRKFCGNYLWKFLVRGLEFVLPFHTRFRYPLPFVAAFSMSYLILYQLVIQWTAHLVIMMENTMKFINEFNITVETIDKLFPSMKPKVENLFYDLQTFAEAYKIILPFGTCIGFGLCMFFTMYMVQNFHKQLYQIAKGDASILVQSEPLPSLAYRLAATMRYSALQLAHLVFTWMLYSFMMAALLSIGLLFYYLFKDFQGFGIHLWSWFMIPLAWSSAMHHLQLFLCRYLFLGKNSKGSRVIFRLKQLYQVLSYVFFFFNVISGVVICFLRVFGVLIFTMVMLFRLDFDVYMRGLEGWDFGHRTYISYLYMESTHNNAILRVFVKLMQDVVTRPKGGRIESRTLSLGNGNIQTGRREEHDEDDENTSLLGNNRRSTRDTSGLHRRRRLNYPRKTQALSVLSSRARNRWLVAYTLLRNPSLIELRWNKLRSDDVIYTQEQNGTSTDYGTVFVHR